MKRYLVDSAAIRQNLETLKKRAGKARLFAVVKGNRSEERRVGKECR